MVRNKFIKRIKKLYTTKVKSEISHSANSLLFKQKHQKISTPQFQQIPNAKPTIKWLHQSKWQDYYKTHL